VGSAEQHLGLQQRQQVSKENPSADTVVPQGSAVNLSIGQKPPPPFPVREMLDVLADDVRHIGP
jgi:hypothetical protein